MVYCDFMVSSIHIAKLANFRHSCNANSDTIILLDRNFQTGVLFLIKTTSGGMGKFPSEAIIRVINIVSP